MESNYKIYLEILIAEEKPECSMAKEIIICVLFVLSITKVKLTTLVSTYILCMFKHWSFRTFSAHCLNCRSLDYRYSLRGRK